MTDVDQDEIEAEAKELVEEMKAEADVDVSDSVPLGPIESRQGSPYNPTRSSSESRTHAPAMGYLPTIPRSSDEAQDEKEVGIDSLDLVDSTSLGLPSDWDEKYERLKKREYQTDTDHSTRLSDLDKKRITQALCSHLDLTPFQQDLVIDRMMELDLTRFGTQKRIENVALAVIRDIVEADRQPDVDPQDAAELSVEELERLYDSYEPMSKDPRYNALLDEFDLDLGDIQSITQTLHEQ